MLENKNNIQATEAERVVNKVSGFWEANSKKMLIGLAALVVLVGGYLGYRYYFSEPNETKASESMFRAQEYFAQDSIRLALNGDNINPGFLKIISRYEKTKAANLARFYAGSIYIKLGDFKNAIKHLEEFSTDSKQIQARATSLLGDAYSELGKKEKAAELYGKAGKLFEKDDFNSPEYLFRAGYLYESMGKNKDAIEMYQIIKDKYSKSERGSDIDKYLARLGAIDADDTSK